MEARLIALSDDYSFNREATPSIGPFLDIIGRHFKQPPEGLGFDDGRVAHVWRTMIDPDRPG